MNVMIRIAKPEDWEIIQKLNNEVFGANILYDRHLDEGWAMSDKGIKYFQKVLAAPDHCCIIAEVDHQPVGYLIGGPKEFDYRTVTMAEIHNTGVTPAHRSKGIGSKLISYFRQWCKDHGYQKMYVNAYFANDKAIAFYKKQGMSPIDISLEMDAM
jgi:GNAT superfamily N-acetyltransferase